MYIYNEGLYLSGRPPFWWHTGWVRRFVLAQTLSLWWSPGLVSHWWPHHTHTLFLLVSLNQNSHKWNTSTCKTFSYIPVFNENLNIIALVPLFGSRLLVWKLKLHVDAIRYLRIYLPQNKLLDPPTICTHLRADKLSFRVGSFICKTFRQTAIKNNIYIKIK